MAAKKKSIDEAQVKEWIERGVKKFENMECSEKKKKSKVCSPGGGCFWFLTFVGALVYFLQQATSFGTVVLGILKAVFWPAVLTYHLLDYLNL